MNRKLVEQSLHSAAIAGLLDGMEGPESSAWRRHWQDVAGKEAAKAMTAAQGALRRDEPFSRQPFDDDERLATRLGVKDRIVELSSEIPGPFGTPVHQMILPAWMVGGLADDEVFHSVAVAPGELRITGSVSGVTFI